ncbi:MAG: exodeoxyribonuclease V subunit RecB [Sodalis sp. Fse]|nr:MAG: exodeoxyribonuclease V subunit RecB [Sodalis sp. Fse]
MQQKETNKIKNTQNFNPMKIPLQGCSLIEASAGTGKTYTLVTIYLRLLLGLGGEAHYPRPLSVEEILVVTFTEAATKELRYRIRDNIYRLRLACVCGSSEDPMLAAILAQLSNINLAASQLLIAERQMDEASIFTIHGFCQRMLIQNPIESDTLFQQTLIEDESFLHHQVSYDFWRRHCSSLPIAVANIIQQYWNGPEALLAEILPYLQGDEPEICNRPDKEDTIIDRHKRIIACIDELKQRWREAESELQEIIDTHRLDHRIYSSKNLLAWLKKIYQWARKPTTDYQVPKELERFRSSVLEENTTQGKPLQHTLFKAVETYYQHAQSLRELVFIMALDEMRHDLEKEKDTRAEIGFDDLLSRFDHALASNDGETLAQSVRVRYPVAMIDEFQDTDPRQYRIFRRLYRAQPNYGLLLIGDPKQSIYAFRGADIFTYMRIRKEMDVRYTLNTNWRSSPGMVNAVNQLFQCLPVPFIFNEIPFSSVAAADSNAGLRLVLQHQPQPAMCFWLQPGAAVGVNEYQQLMAQQCATTIRNWLSASLNGDAWLEGKQRQPLQASDITVLVRNHNEAALVHDALATLAIPTVYLSNRNNVFKTPEAREILWLLQAVVTPEQDNALRCALATSLLGFDAVSLEFLNTDEQSWENRIKEFADYRLCWQNRGVLPMLRQMIIHHRIAENLLASSDGKRRLTDLLHLGELLQEASTQLKNEYALVRWLALQIESPNLQGTNQQLRLESDRHLVQITTVHKSKGLEFPLVFLPFAANFRQQKRPLFHDRQQYQAWLDLSAAPQSLKFAEEERLAEDLRLFYVAVTRSIYHCSIGIAPLFHGNRKKSGNSDLHLSAPGYLIQQGKASNAGLLYNQLEALQARAGDDIAFCLILNTQTLPLAPTTATNKPLAARHWKTPIHDPWMVTSYTGLHQQSTSVMMDLQPQLDVDTVGKNNQQEVVLLTPHTFPRGALPGTFLHHLFETLDFTRPLNSQWLSSQLKQNNIEAIWLPVVQQWIASIIHMPLDGETLSLSHLSPDNRLTELQFYLSIDATLSAQDLDRLCKHYDPLSARCLPLDFPKVKGMLKGFIDLVFRWQGRYYLLDYKSNWLGENTSDYTWPALEQAMIDHRYELQYQLYTLALHRFLRHRQVNYDYQRDFGGIFYLFLRGIDPKQPGNGIYSCRPNLTLIDGIDSLLAGDAVYCTSDRLALP